MSEQVILGMSFIAMIYPFNADMHGIKTNVMSVISQILTILFGR
jgi:hypothetical protein